MRDEKDLNFFQKIEQNTKFNDENRILTKYNYLFEFSIKKQKKPN